MKKSLKIFALVILTILAYYAEVIFTQRNLIYVPDTKPVDEKITTDAGFQKIQLKTSDDLDLQSWYHPSDGHHGTMLFLHGNAGNVTGRVKFVVPYLQLGYGVLLLEYRGYSTNPGKPSEEGLKQDAEAAWRFLTEQQHIAASEIVVMGESLGTGLAVYMAAAHPVDKLILQSPYTSLIDVGSYQYPYLPVRWFLVDRFPANEWIKKVHAPVLMLHGDQDDVIPITLGRELFGLANEPKKFVVLKGMHHDLFSPELVQEVTLFLQGFAIKENKSE